MESKLNYCHCYGLLAQRLLLYLTTSVYRILLPQHQIPDGAAVGLDASSSKEIADVDIAIGFGDELFISRSPCDCILSGPRDLNVLDLSLLLICSCTPLAMDDVLVNFLNKISFVERLMFVAIESAEEDT